MFDGLIKKTPVMPEKQKKSEDEEKKIPELKLPSSDGERSSTLKDSGVTPPLKPFSRNVPNLPAKKSPYIPISKHSGAPFVSDIPKRVQDIPATPSYKAEETESSNDNGKTLIVGEGIHLSGEITACDHLVVSGCVQAELSDIGAIEIKGKGVFKGKADVEYADIKGNFKGELVVHNELIVRSSGNISGEVIYNKIIIEAGGKINGTMQSIEKENETDSDIEESED